MFKALLSARKRDKTEREGRKKMRLAGRRERAKNAEEWATWPALATAAVPGAVYYFQIYCKLNDSRS
jgi:hypothetical protein